MEFTTMMKCRMSAEFLWNTFPPNSIQCGFEPAPRATEPTPTFQRLSYPLPLLLKTSTIQPNHLFSEMPLRLHSCSSKTSLHPGTLILHCLPSQAIQSNYFHQQFHHRFCIKPAALSKQAGPWFTKGQISEKDYTIRAGQELWKTAFAKPANMIRGFFIISSENHSHQERQSWKTESYGLYFTPSLTSKDAPKPQKRATQVEHSGSKSLDLNGIMTFSLLASEIRSGQQNRSLRFIILVSNFACRYVCPRDMCLS